MRGFDTEPCAACNGQGWVMRLPHSPAAVRALAAAVPNEPVTTVREACGKCGGDGKQLKEPPHDHP